MTLIIQKNKAYSYRTINQYATQTRKSKKWKSDY